MGYCGALAHPVVPAETPPWPRPAKGRACLATSHHPVTLPSGTSGPLFKTENY